jgi:hypothetical protein
MLAEEYILIDISQLMKVCLIIFCSCLAFSCTQFLDSTSLIVFKENSFKESDVLFSGRLRDIKKGYWQVYIVKGNRFEIRQADSVPLKKGTEHLYAGTYVTNRDTLKLQFVRNHLLPNLEYVLLMDDTCFIKLSVQKEPLALIGWHTKN